MRNYRGVLVLIILILLSLLFCFSFIKEIEIKRLSLVKENYIEIHKNIISIYNDKDILLDSYRSKKKIKDYSIGNIMGDNKDYLVILKGSNWSKYGKEVIIFLLEDKIEEIYRKDYSELKPWKIAIGDVDGDGVDEISIGVYKESPLHEVMAKRPFIYSFIDGELRPKWRGSRLARPFIDYIIFDLDGDGIDEIISIEILEDNRKIINSYKWKGFGFEGYLESKSYDDIDNIRIEQGIIYLLVKDGRTSYSGQLKSKGNNLIIERAD